ncbi:DUF4145 domain-containing protein [Xenorhabdus bovienii]|uniref:DUF4145 domain-containing protein n=1 Tax=Xenorhabdus bovienii TaxID=40576 RepID=UPI0023B27296|nr:DUF4145 domain-containing protein [Xenorhabdus bovienii]MDE9543725.1 DUF4145 domain-containing protein [Xenorhabdus bovienii]
MSWADMIYQDGTASNLQKVQCLVCKQDSIWLTKDRYFRGKFVNTIGKMIHPDQTDIAPPENDMPDGIKEDYNEAASIFSRSPRGAAALLRLGLQKLCKHLGEKGENINNDIRSLAGKNVLPPLVISVADTVRITGNNAVHPGEMNDEDFDLIASKLFGLLNFIVRKGIVEPKELQSLYERMPEKPRQSAEAADQRNKSRIDS